jgi:hypothetical protein
MNVKDIFIQRIDSGSAIQFIKRYHYSGKVVSNSSLHFGCFIAEKLIGVLSFGPSFDKKKIIGLVKGTAWNEFVELNRMAFINDTPRNTESRCIGVCIRLIKKHCPHIKWIVSFADATQCGDGTVYRAAGFKLCGIKKNRSIIRLPDGRVVAGMTFTKGTHI